MNKIKAKTQAISSFYYLTIILLCISCNNDSYLNKNGKQIHNKINNQVITQYIDDTNLKNQIIFFTEVNNTPFNLSKNELNKIVKLFPLFNFDTVLNPYESYLSSGEWKDYIDKDNKKQHYSFGSEQGQDKFYLVYSYLLKQKNGNEKYKNERENLIKLFRSVNSIYSDLNYGGTYFSHQYYRINAFAEYSIYQLNKNKEFFDKNNDFENQKRIYINSIKNQIIEAESKNVYYQIDLVENKQRASEREKELNEEVENLNKLIMNNFYLTQVIEFESNYR